MIRPIPFISRKTVDPTSARELALKNAIKQLETQFGKGSVMKLGSREKLDIASTARTWEYLVAVLERL